MAEENKTLTQWLAKLMAMLSTFIVTAVGGPIPDTMKEAVSCLLILMIIDTGAGVYTAIILQKLRSRHFIEGITTKCVIFSIAGSAGIVASMMTNTYVWTYLAILAGIICELMSLIEKTKKLRERVGKEFGIIDRFLVKLERMFESLADNIMPDEKIHIDTKTDIHTQTDIRIEKAETEKGDVSKTQKNKSI